MKNRMFVSLLLSTVLAHSGFTQQSNPNSSAQAAASPDRTAPASQNAGATGKEPLQPTTGGDFWEGDEPNLANLVSHPLTTKKYVRRQIQPLQDRVNELEELTASNSKKIRDVDARAQQSIQLASEKTNEADQHAIDAGNKAEMANLRATQATTRVSTDEQMVGKIHQYIGSAHTEIRFRPGQSVLSKKAKDALDEMAAPLKDERSYVIEVRGFAPGRGQAAIATSQKMADSVVRYLVLNHKIPVYRIYVVGMGNAAATGEDGTVAKYTSSGRVEISLLKNDLASSAQH